MPKTAFAERVTSSSRTSREVRKVPGVLAPSNRRARTIFRKIGPSRTIALTVLQYIVGVETRCRFLLGCAKVLLLPRMSPRRFASHNYSSSRWRPPALRSTKTQPSTRTWPSTRSLLEGHYHLSTMYPLGRSGCIQRNVCLKKGKTPSSLAPGLSISCWRWSNAPEKWSLTRI